MADDAKYEIKFATTSDPKGANETVASVDKVAASGKRAASSLNEVKNASAGTAKAAKETGEAARTLGDDLSDMGSRNNATKDVLEGTEQALRGNTDALFGTAKAARNLIEVFTVSTPLGRLIQLLTIAAGVFAIVREKMFGAGKEAQDTATKFDHLTKAFEKIATAKSDAFKKELTTIKEEAKAAADELQRIFDMRAALNKGTLDARNAEIAADPNLSSSGRAVQSQINVEKSVQEMRAIEDAKLLNAFDAARKASEATAAAAAAKQQERDKLQATVDSHAPTAVEGRIRELKGQREALVNKLAQDIHDANQGLPGFKDVETLAREGRENIAPIDKELAAQRASLAAAKSPEVTAFNAEQAKLLEKIKTDAEEAKKTATEAAEKLRLISQELTGPLQNGRISRDPTFTMILGAEDDARRASDAKALRDAIAEDEAAKRPVDPAARRRLGELTAPWSAGNSSGNSVSGFGSIIINGTPYVPAGGPDNIGGRPLSGGGEKVSIPDADGNNIGREIGRMSGDLLRDHGLQIIQGFRTALEAEADRIRQETEEKLKALRR
jgi:hypothetical protein